MKMYGAEFLDSVFGQKLQYNKRFRKKICITYTPTFRFHTKNMKLNSIRDMESLKFQTRILDYLVQHKRNQFRGNVAIEFYLSISHKNPPAPHSFLKHYIDLLHKPLKGLITTRKSLLIKDDQQIKALGFIKQSNSANVNELTLFIYPYNNLIEDLLFVKKLQLTSEFDNEKSYDYTDNLIEDQNTNNDSKTLLTLAKNHPDEIELQKEIDFQNKWTNFQREENKRNIFTNHSKLGRNLLLDLLIKPTKIFSDDEKITAMITDISRKLLLNDLYNIDFGKVPTEIGDRSKYFNNINLTITDFKKKIVRFFPRNAFISLKLFYEKPRGNTHDLDNLLSHILPSFQEIILDNQTKHPIFSIELYQILTQPKHEESGKLYLKIEEAGSNYLFHRINDIIESYFDKFNYL